MSFEREEQPYYIFKICLLGQGGVGKTCIARRLCFNTFDANTRLTIGIDFYTYDLPILVEGDETFIRLSIWDFGVKNNLNKCSVITSMEQWAFLWYLVCSTLITHCWGWNGGMSIFLSKTKVKRQNY